MNEKVIKLKLAVCEVCGAEFQLKRKYHYIAKDAETTGLVALAGGPEAAIYDAFDCPCCGCQNIVQERKRKYKTITTKELKEALSDE